MTSKAGGSFLEVVMVQIVLDNNKWRLEYQIDTLIG